MNNVATHYVILTECIRSPLVSVPRNILEPTFKRVITASKQWMGRGWKATAGTLVGLEEAHRMPDS